MTNASNQSYDEVSELITTEQAAKLLGVTKRFLEQDRSTALQNGTKPKVRYVKYGHRTVRYDRNDIMDFLNRNRKG